jgi:aminopeptidase N
MRRALILIGVVASVAAAIAAAALFWRMPARVPAVEPGVSSALARSRAARVSDVAYQVNLGVPAASRDPVRGELTARFTLAPPMAPLVMDFAQPPDHLIATQANGAAVNTAPVAGHIVIPAEVLREGVNTVTFSFLAGDGPLNRSDDFLYTIFVPARASHALPCFDQPDLKARWTLTLEVPAGWAAVSNGRESGRVEAGGRTSLIFDETPPIAPYLFAFAAGRFAIETAVRDGRRFRMFHR